MSDPAETALSLPKTALEGKPIDDKDHQFWKTQPVPQVQAAPTVKEELKKKKFVASDFTGAEIETKTVDQVQQEPYPVASILEWFTPDIVGNKADLDAVYHLLYENYVEDDDAMFRFDY